MLQVTMRFGERLVLLRRLCLVMLPLLCLALPLHAASPPAAATAADQPAKVRELLGLLGDPQVQEWIKAQQADHEAKSPAPSGETKSVELLASRLAGICGAIAISACIWARMPASRLARSSADLASPAGAGGLAS